LFSLKDASSVAREPEIAAAIEAVDRYLLAASGPQHFRRTQNAARGEAGVAAEADVAAYRGIAGLGLTSATLPESQGGSGFAPGVAALIGERLGWSLAREPFVENVVLPFALLQALGAPAAGETEIVCVAWQEGAFAMPDVGTIRTKATAEGAGWRLQGTKRFVMGARASTRMLVLASMDGAPAIISVPSANATRKDTRLADGSTWSDVGFDALVEPAAVLGRGEESLRALTHALDLTNLAIAGVLHGLQSRILAMTLEYLGTREQFGKPLGAFQALQHRAVDLYTHAQISRFLVGEAVDAVGPAVTPQLLAAYASRAKARTVDSASRIAKEGIQMHGAIGFSDEYDLGLYVKRILVLSAWLGGAVWHRRRYAALDAPDASH
jgi:alkylation response protein AidB-like acyl-CoA dehydrogenase